MDKEKVFMGVQLEEIKGIGRDNGRNIADNSLRLMSIQDNVNELKELGTEIKEENKEIKLILNQLLESQKDFKRCLDSVIDRVEYKDSEYLKVGAM